MTIRIVIDCDTGTDDALALMLAALHPGIELLAVSTVHGNVPLANATENTLRVLDHIGSTAPVYPGAARPFMRPDFPIPRVALNERDPDLHPPYLDLPSSVSTPRPESAAWMIIDTFMNPANSDVVLVATGPLTNVALALAVEPRLASRIDRLVLMGGVHVGGNVTPTAEFNIWVDPESAQSVFSAGLRDIVVLPLDATHSAPLTLADCAAFDALGTPAGSAAAALLRHRIVQDHNDLVPGEESAPVHDPLCVAFLLRPDVITSSGRYPVSVETTGRTIGEMIIDTRPWTTDPPNATVAFSASTAVFREVLREAFAIDHRSG